MDDDNALIHPEEGVPHADVSSIEDNVLSRFSGHPSSTVHNPYGCFGAPGVSWPRGYPLRAIQDDSPHHSGYCDVDGISGSRIGVVQALANHDPDVDAIYRLTHPPGALPFSFNPGAPGTPESTLRGVPADKMTPYNAQVRQPTATHRQHPIKGQWHIDLSKMFGASARSKVIPFGAENGVDKQRVLMSDDIPAPRRPPGKRKLVLYYDFNFSGDTSLSGGFLGYVATRDGAWKG